MTRRLGKFLSRWGVDKEQYAVLLHASFKMDFRAPSSVLGPNQQSTTKSALKMTIWMNALFSVIMSMSLVATGAGTLFYSVVMLGYAMVMLAMSILIEFGLVVVSPDDFLILAHRPVSSRTFFAVKCSNLLFYVLLLGLSLNVAPAFAGWACRGSDWHFPIIYVLVASMASVFVAGAMVAFYGLLLRTVNYERFKDLLVYCQIAFSFLFFFGYQIVPRLAGDIRSADVTTLTHSWAIIFPSTWFAGAAESLLGHVTWETAALGAFAITMLILVLPLTIKHVSLDYSEQLGAIAGSSSKTTSASQGKPRAGLFSTWMNRFLVRDVEERAFFHFVLAMFRRNRLLKLQVYPNFGVVIAMLAVGIVQGDELGDPFESRSFGGFAAMMIPIMAFSMGATGVVAALPFSDEFEGAGFFRSRRFATARRF